MQNKWNWAMALVLLGVLGWVFWRASNHVDESPNETSKTSAPTPEAGPQDPLTTAEPASLVAAEEAKPPANQDDEAVVASDQGMSEASLTALLDMLADAQYSDDPLVEAIALIQQHNHCSKNRIRQNSRDGHPNLGVSAVQQATLDALKQRCQNSKERHPFLGDFHQFNQIMHTLPNLPSRSLLGDHFRNHPEDPDLDMRRARLHLKLMLGVKERNSQVITSGLDNLQWTHMKVHPRVEQLLGGQDQTYLKWVTQTALGLISCDFNGGITCRPGGVLVLDQCLQNERHCPMTFAQWFADISTPAMRSDVQKVIDFYQQQAATL